MPSVPVFLLALLATAASAQKLPPWFTPYPGSTVFETTRVFDFDQIEMLVGEYSDDKDTPKSTTTVEGRVTIMAYTRPKDRSILEVYTNYAEALTKAGFKTLYSCTGGVDCGTSHLFKGVGHVPNGRDARYLAAKLTRPEGDVHVAMQVSASSARFVIVETKPMQRGLVKVTAEALAADLVSEGHAALYGILFDTNKADVRPESAPTLAEIASLLQKNPSMKLHVVGHTDNVGQVVANVDLSRRRAEAVVRELVAKHKVSADRLRPEGLGPFAPVAPNTSDAGRQKNRRVELVVQ